MFAFVICFTVMDDDELERMVVVFKHMFKNLGKRSVARFHYRGLCLSFVVIMSTGTHCLGSCIGFTKLSFPVDILLP